MQLAAHIRADGRHSMTASMAAPPSQRDVEKSVLVDTFDMDGEDSSHAMEESQELVMNVEERSAQKHSLMGCSCWPAPTESLALSMAQLQTWNNRHRSLRAGLRIKQLS